MLKNKLLHNRVLTIRFIGPTNTLPSRVAIYDAWHNERVYLSLSGADMMETVEEFLGSKEINMLSYGWTTPSTDKGVILVDNFDKHIK